MSSRQITLAISTAIGIFLGVIVARSAHADYPYDYGTVYMGEAKEIGCKLYTVREKDATFTPSYVVAICDAQPVCTTTSSGKTTTTVCTKTYVDK